MTTTYPFTNRKDAIRFIKAQGGPIETELIEHGRGKYEVVVTSADAEPADEWVELSDDEVTDMSEAFAADAEEDDALAALAAIVAHKDDKGERNALILAALDAETLTAKRIAEALGIEARAVREAADRLRVRQAA
ncbi:hypothetical protein SEA_NICOLE72_17 [Microbacterium phage Nicole72]|uniref:Uncharacterized protein n=1 Tax=Microbacterium phage Nicole72 TaxID=3062838 RepID=A0ACD4UHJ4_9CAUD|nr:hypothetical protein SEA_NICOLE72_17 [Microbacterium phage Nicole72]